MKNLFSNSMIKIHQLVLIGTLFCLCSCRSDKPEDAIKPNISLNNAHGLYVLNEGNFQFGNASVTYYNLDNGSLVEDIYKMANGNNLGDVAQSMTLINGWYYLVVNNSQKIEVINPENFLQINRISSLLSPRYILQVSKSKAYISDFKSNRISIINLNSNSKQGEIIIHGWTEEMHLMYGKAYITNMSNDKLYIVNTANDMLEDSLTLAQSPGSLTEDKNGKLWVLCQGDAPTSKTGALFCINPENKVIEKRMDFSSSDAPMRLCINESLDTLYFINKHLFQVPIEATSLPQNPLIDGNSKNFYGLAIQPKTGNIFISDALDYIQKGTIFVYNSKGALLKEFKSGLIPSKIYFK